MFGGAGAQAVLDGMEQRAVHALRIAKSDLGLGGMDIDIDQRGIDAQKQRIGRMPVAVQQFAVGLARRMDDQVELRLARPAGAVALFLSLLGLWQLLIQGLTAPDGSVLAPASGYRGGFLGYQLARILTGALGLAPAAVVLILVAGYGAGTVAGLSLREMLDRLGQLLFDGAGRLWNQRGSLGGALRAGGRSLWGARPAALSKDARPEDDASAAPLVTPTDTRPVQTALALDGRGEASAPPPVAPPAAADDAAPAAPLPASGAQWTLPDMAGLLDAPLDVVRSPEEAELLARTIEQTLAEFGIPVEVVQINVGPTITQFGQPSPENNCMPFCLRH